MCPGPYTLCNHHNDDSKSAENTSNLDFQSWGKGDFPGSPVVKTALPLQGTRLWSLVGELRPCQKKQKTKQTNTKVGARDAGGITHCCDVRCQFKPLQVQVADWDYTEFFQSFGPAGVKNKSSRYFGCSSSSAFLKGCVALACEKGTQKSLRRALHCAQIPDAHPIHPFILPQTCQWLCSGQVSEASAPDTNVSPCKTQKRVWGSRFFQSRALLSSHITGQKSCSESPRGNYSDGVKARLLLVFWRKGSPCPPSGWWSQMTRALPTWLCDNRRWSIVQGSQDSEADEQP